MAREMAGRAMEHGEMPNRPTAIAVSLFAGNTLARISN
jgi:hypothetical protein